MLLYRLVIFYFLFYAASATNSFAQTSIGPLIGYEFSTIMTYDNYSHFSISEEPLSINNPLYGLKIEQKLTDRHRISLQGNFSRKKLSIWTSEFVPVDRAEMDAYRISLCYKHAMNNVYFTIGPYVDLIRNARDYQAESDIIHSRIPGFEEYGILTSVGYGYKNIGFEIFCYYGISELKKETFFINHKPFFSIGASISYLFKLSFKSNGKKVVCPKF